MKIQQSEGRPLAEQTSLVPRVAICPFLNERFPPLDQLLTCEEVARLVRRPRWYFCSLALIGGFPAKRRFRGRWAGWMRSDVSQWMQKNLRIPGAHPTKACPAKVIAHQRRLALRRAEGCPSPRRRRRPRWPPKCNGTVLTQVCVVERPASVSRPAAEDRT
jgi:predicted DNA-binding transcriptional regulator AlpA